MKKIGGEFEINPIVFNEMNLEDHHLPFLYSNGRIALLAILNHLKSAHSSRIIHLPFYICSSVVDACRSAGFNLKFYELTENFEFPMEYLDFIGSNEVLLTVCYFGIINDNVIITEVKKRRNDVICISDQVMSYWTFKNSVGDYSFTSLRKHFAIPEGALVNTTISIDDLYKETSINSFYKDKYIAAFLKFAEADESTYLELFSQGENLIDQETKEILQASKLSRYLYLNTEFEEIQSKRKVNANFVYEYGKSLGFEFVFPKISKDSTPQHIPIWVSDGINLRKKLFEEKIYLPIHWPGDSFNETSSISKKMQTQSISLIIDQRYDLQDLERMLNAVKRHE